MMLKPGLGKRVASGHKFASISVVSVLAMVLGAQPATAHIAPADGAGSPVALEDSDDIVVMARKRAENVQDIPIAVTALRKDLVEDGNFDEVTEFLELVPNVKFKPDDFSSSDISIRGSSRSTNAEDPGVGINRDGVYIGGLLTSFSNFYDVARVEILRGPQAGLYGRNAVGGALNVFTEKPTLDRVKGYVEAQYGNKERLELRGAVNIPLVADKLAVRLSGLAIDQNKGFQHVVNQDQYADAYDNRSIRARILYAPGSDIELLTTAEYLKSHGSPTGIMFNAPYGQDRMVGNLVLEATTSDDLDNIMRNLPFQQESEQYQISQQVDVGTSFGDITAIVSYRDTTLTSSLDNDATNYDLDRFYFDGAQDSLFGELRLSSNDLGGLRFTVGANYLKEHLKLNQQYTSGGLFGADFAQWYTTGLVTANPFGIPVGTPLGAIGLTPLGNAGGWSGVLGDSFPVSSINEQSLESFAVFLETSYQLTDRLDIWANARYTRDRKNIDFGQRFGNELFACPTACGEIFSALFGGLNPQIGASTSARFSNFSPGGGINFKVDDNILLYGKAVTGFKAGGFNNLAGSIINLPFESEKTLSFEVGAKLQMWDKRFTLNAAAFTQKRSNALVSIIDPDLPVVAIGVNAGAIRNRGVELEARLLPLERLEILASAGYLDSEFLDFVSGGEDFAGKNVPQTFKYSLSAIIRYTQPISRTLSAFGYLSYSNAWDGYTNSSNLRKLASPETLDVRLGVKSDRWKLIGFVDNLTKTRYSPYENDSPLGGAPDGNHKGTFSAGRTYGVQVALSF